MVPRGVFHSRLGETLDCHVNSSQVDNSSLHITERFQLIGLGASPQATCTAMERHLWARLSVFDLAESTGTMAAKRAMYLTKRLFGSMNESNLMKRKVGHVREDQRLHLRHHDSERAVIQVTIVTTSSTSNTSCAQKINM